MNSVENQRAPVALFAYSRLEVLKETVAALLANDGVEGTPLYIFADGPKKEEHREGVEKVRDYLKSIEWPGEVHYHFSEKNCGLAASIKSGVTQVAGEHGRVIVVEDDILTHRKFLAFMNSALDAYADNKRVFNVNGMGIPERFVEFPDDCEDTTYFSYRPTSHGWATWHSKWDLACWDEDKIVELVNTPHVRARFRRMGSDCIPMLVNAMSNKVDSWAIRWAFSLAIYNGVCITPRKALSSHQPSDSGTHVKGSHEMIEHDFDEKTGVFSLPSTIRMISEATMSFARKYGPIQEGDFKEPMKLKDLTLSEIGGGIKLIDIGASGALNEKWKALEPLISLVAFDPNEEECKRLTEEGAGDFAEATYLPYAIAGESGEATLYQTESMFCWSLLEPDHEWLSRFSFSNLFVVNGTEQIHVKTLDSIEELKGADIDAAKLDVQGMEMPILSQSNELLASLFYLETETGFTANYQDETQFYQLSDFLQKKGFLMFDINPNHRVRRKGPFEKNNESLGQPLWCEAVWLKDFKNPLNESYIDGLTRPKALRILLLCAVEGFYDYGWEVAGILRERDLISETEFESLSEIENWRLLTKRQAQRKPASNFDAWDYFCAAARKVKRVLGS